MVNPGEDPNWHLAVEQNNKFLTNVIIINNGQGILQRSLALVIRGIRLPLRGRAISGRRVHV